MEVAGDIMKKFDAKEADVFVYTEREGMLAPIGHDLKIEVNRFEVEVSDDGQIRAEFDPASLEVLGAMHNGKLDRDDISAKDRKKIEKNIVKDVLEVRKFAGAEFESTRVERDGESLEVRGMLSLHGVRNEVSFRLTHQLNEWATRFVIHQPDYDIEPYKALLGQLRLKADLEVEFRVGDDVFDDLPIA